MSLSTIISIGGVLYFCVILGIVDSNTGVEVAAYH